MISKTTTTALILALLALVGTITAGTSISVVPAYADDNGQGENDNGQGENEDDQGENEEALVEKMTLSPTRTTYL